MVDWKLGQVVQLIDKEGKVRGLAVVTAVEYDRFVVRCDDGLDTPDGFKVPHSIIIWRATEYADEVSDEGWSIKPYTPPPIDKTDPRQSYADFSTVPNATNDSPPTLGDKWAAEAEAKEDARDALLIALAEAVDEIMDVALDGSFRLVNHRHLLQELREATHAFKKVGGPK